MIRIDRLARQSEVTDGFVISRYDRADLDGDDELSWSELKQFQREVYRVFRYENNGKALRRRSSSLPEEETARTSLSSLRPCSPTGAGTPTW